MKDLSELLEELAQTVKDSSLCGLGKTAQIRFFLL